MAIVQTLMIIFLTWMLCVDELQGGGKDEEAEAPKSETADKTEGEKEEEEPKRDEEDIPRGWPPAYIGDVCEDLDKSWSTSWSIRFVMNPQELTCHDFAPRSTWCNSFGDPDSSFTLKYRSFRMHDHRRRFSKSSWAEYFNVSEASSFLFLDKVNQSLVLSGQSKHPEHQFGPDFHCCACGLGGSCNPGYVKLISPRDYGCRGCESGKYSPISISWDTFRKPCQKCDKGKYTPSLRGKAQGHTECLPCEAGKFAQMMGTASCLACPSGRFSEAGSPRCQWCPLGRYARTDGKSECTGCPAGWHSTKKGASFCDACPLGKYSQSNASKCRLCNPGTYALLDGAASCNECEPGSFQFQSRSTSCILCPIGSFAEASGMTECEACGAGRASVNSWTTMHKIQGELHKLKGRDEWFPLSGASSSKYCGCDKDLREQDGECIECGEGMTCPGMGNVSILPGYYSSLPISVYHCFRDILSCPGGLPGSTCAEGRVGISCARCEDFKKPASDGTCVECTVTDRAPIVASCIALGIGLCLAYYALVTRSKVEQSHTVMLTVIACSQLLTWVQQLGVIAMLEISYEDPLKSFLEAISIFILDLRVLNIDCMGKLGPVAHLVSKVVILFASLVFLTLIHVASVLLFHRGHFRKRMPAYLSAISTACFLTLIVVVCTVLAPLQCTQHPNNEWTVRAYKDVTCWEAKHANDHSVMVIAGLCGLAFPIGFFSCTLYIAWQLPQRIHKGDVDFLETYGFLFFRFRPGVGWYINVMLVRSFVIALAPVVPNSAVQILMFGVCHQASLMSVMHYKPWRVDIANYSDIACSLSMLMVVFMALIFLNEQDLRAASWICIGILLCTMVSVLMAFLRPISAKCARKRKPYKFFLCHHKARAGAFARLLKETFVEHPCISRDVFLDSDNLRQLNDLFHTVASDIDTLLVIGSKDVFLRPWCAGEMTIARMIGINVIILAMPDWEPPNKALIASFGEVVDMTPLTENRLSLSMVQTTLHWISSLPVIQFPRQFNFSTLDLLARYLVSYEKNPGMDPKILYTSAMGSQSSVADKNVLILVDDTDTEAVAAAHLLVLMMLPHTMHSPQNSPSVLLASAEVLSDAETIILICTNGCFESHGLLKALVHAFALSAKVLPVVVDSNFRFPTSEVLQSVRNRSWIEIGISGDDLADIIADIFTEIAMFFHPQHAPNTVLRTDAKRISERVLDSSMRPIGTERKRLSRIAGLSRVAGRDVSMRLAGSNGERFSAFELFASGSVSMNTVRTDGFEVKDEVLEDFLQEEFMSPGRTFL